MSNFEQLYQSIQTRPRPEDVAELVLETLGESLLASERKVLEKAARYSFKRYTHTYSSMASDFSRVVGAGKQVESAHRFFPTIPVLTASDCMNVEKVEAYMAQLSAIIQVDPAHVDFKTHRLNRVQRRAAGITDKKRLYNKRFRALRRIKLKIERMIVNGKKYLATRIAKSAGATKVTKADLEKDLNTACFIAYLSARMNMRSAFTNSSQVRAFDEVAEMLYKRAVKHTPNWWAIALIHPESTVIAHLSEDEKGQLFGMWTETLHMLAVMLYDLDKSNSFDLKNCIVHRGNDSTTWNAVAGAWNKARDHWMTLAVALGMDSLLDHYCPGKVLRLMAADVARWHDDLHPDTYVWQALPKPWEVFEDQAVCTRAQVEAACKTAYKGKEGSFTGWTGPKPDKKAVGFTPTPELVHGVTVSSPFLATLVKKAGWFSGKASKGVDVAAEIVRDAHGAAILVDMTQKSV